MDYIKCPYTHCRLLPNEIRTEYNSSIDRFMFHPNKVLIRPGMLTHVAICRNEHQWEIDEASRLEILNTWMSWVSQNPKPPDIVCFHCGNTPVAETWVVNGITVGACAYCLNRKPTAGTKEVSKKRGCKKCEYTGFAYGKIPCECNG